MRAAEVRALYALLEEDFSNIDVLRERLRRIIAPERPPISPVLSMPEAGERLYVPRMD